MKNVMEMSLDSLSKKKQLDPKQEIAIEEKPSDELLIQRMREEHEDTSKIYPARKKRHY